MWEAEESASDRELSPDAPVRTGPPKKKLKQRTLPFVPALASPSTAASSTSESDTSVSVNQDIGENAGSTSTTTCTSDCCKGGLVPYQPTEIGELQLLQRKQGQRYRRFSPSWYSTYPWITVCTTKGKAFCVYCRYYSSKGLLQLAKKGDDAFILAGFDNWKNALEKFKQHSTSDLHKRALLSIELMQQEDIQSLISHQASTLHKSRQQMLIKQLSSLKYLLRQGMAVRGHEEMEGNLLQLLKLRSNDCSQLNTWIRERKYFRF